MYPYVSIDSLTDIRVHYSELTTIIESPDSPFNNSDASMPADTGVHSPLENPVEMNGPLPKRKRTEDGATGPTASNDLTNPRYPDLMRSNSRIRKLQEKLKKECSQLSDYCVSSFFVQAMLL